jgi:two-component system cell cycle sensor histidine kinase/response regulator CckA
MESVGQLAAGVAHDFNNMLTVIQGHTGMLMARSDSPPELRDSLQAIFFAAERAAGLTRQLLLFSRKSVLQTRLLDLREILGNMGQMLKRLLGRTRCHRVQSAAGNPAGPRRRRHDRAGHHEPRPQCARRHARRRQADPQHPVGHGRFRVRSDASGGARAGSFVYLRVTDTGCGMDAATRSRVFEPFFTTKEPGKGTGLGLATVYGIVKQHDGWLEVNSEPGKGTTFDIFFPAESEMAVAPKPEIILPAPVTGGTETILIVEDEPVLREMARDILASCGYQILEASSGRDALDVWNRNPGKIDLLLTDMVMPEGVSGVELAEKLLHENPQIRIIFTSGYTANDLNSKMLERNHAYFLQKPYSHNDLAKAVRDCLDNKNAVANEVAAA